MREPPSMWLQTFSESLTDHCCVAIRNGGLPVWVNVYWSHRSAAFFSDVWLGIGDVGVSVLRERRTASEALDNPRSRPPIGLYLVAVRYSSRNWPATNHVVRVVMSFHWLNSFRFQVVLQWRIRVLLSAVRDLFLFVFCYTPVTYMIITCSMRSLQVPCKRFVENVVRSHKLRISSNLIPTIIMCSCFTSMPFYEQKCCFFLLIC